MFVLRIFLIKKKREFKKKKMDIESEDDEMSVPLFDRVCDLAPSLKIPTRVIVIGLRYCPYSSLARDLIRKHKHLSNNHKFIVFDESLTTPFRSANEFRDQTGYTGSYPVVFVQNPKGNMVHIGGATNLENLLARGW